MRNFINAIAMNAQFANRIDCANEAGIDELRTLVAAQLLPTTVAATAVRHSHESAPGLPVSGLKAKRGMSLLTPRTRMHQTHSCWSANKPCCPGSQPADCRRAYQRCVVEPGMGRTRIETSS